MKHPLHFLLLAMLPVTVTAMFPARTNAAEPLPLPPARGHYLVVTGVSTAAQPAWREVCDILRRKHEADLVIVPDGRPGAARPVLQKFKPNYVCFVARPEEAGREYVQRIHGLMRGIDDDPYVDAMWGILTGYEAADARRIAERGEPLYIKSGFSSMGPGLAQRLGAGFASSETDAHAFWRIDADGQTQAEAVDPDPTRALAQAFAKTPPDLVHTSGHATERDWQIGYTVKAGQFRCEVGQLYALGVDGTRTDINSPAPKVYMPMGNCLIGHVSGKDCMATAWMHSGGAYQMYGYTAVTFFGYMGWGVGTYFDDGRLTLAQSFQANSQALLYQLQTRFPDRAGVVLDDFQPQHISQTANRHGVADRDLLGLLWDRDTVAFYGDPAWEARMPPGTPNWQIALERRQTKGASVRYTLALNTTADGSWPNRPVVFPIEEKLENIRAVKTSGVTNAVVMDDFILLPLTGAYPAGMKIRVTFTAESMDLPATRADRRPIQLAELNPEEQALLDTFPATEREGLQTALVRAGDNREEIIKALAEVPPRQRSAMAFLVVNMPDPDLELLGAALLLAHVDTAWQAWTQSPWHTLVDENLFCEAVLPYASLDEPREAWMAEMRRRCLPLVKTCTTPGEAAMALNQQLFKQVGVQYHATRRPKPNQNPSESMAAGYASCTGLSILLVDACRSVGVPARVAGVARWTEGPGNHTWVEVWDGGTWHPVGAAESAKLGEVWFREAAAKADPRRVHTRIYAARFARSATRFPLAWHPGYPHVSALDVTAAYKHEGRP